jgi:predicted negative regulator of RcsB-dependent stress response
MTRHELKAQDYTTTKLQTLTETAFERKKEILLIAGAILVIVLAYVGWGIYTTRRNTEAQNQLGAAIAAYTDPTLTSDKARYEKSIAEAQKTIDSYGSLPAAVIARYYIALSKDGLGDTAGAIQDLGEVIAKGDATTKAIAQFALAGIHQKHGDSPKAVEVLKQLDTDGGYSASAVKFELGKVLEASKQPDQAKGYYEKVVTDFADSPFRADAEAALRRMGFTVPTPPAAAAPNPS